MHKILLDLVVASCRERIQTDCPISPRFGNELLEGAVVELANEVVRLQNEILTLKNPNL